VTANMKNAPIRVLIADDEALARKFIRRMLKDDHDVEIVGECTNGKEAVAMIRKQNPDVVFLDVQMPEMDGFAVLESIGIERLPQIIFATAYEQYALRAFELHALDYLLKPFDQARFKNAIKHAKERFRSERQSEGRTQISALLESIKNKPQYLDRLMIKAGGRISFLRTDEISWIEADDKYVHLHTGKISPMVRQTLSAMETQLDPRKFRRIHRSAIVNVERIKELQPLFSGEHSILLQDGTKLTLSRKYKDKLFEFLGKPL
jgi:two-component system, LytTR family, response regulator